MNSRLVTPNLFRQRSTLVYSALLALSFAATYGYLLIRGAAPAPAFWSSGSSAQASTSAVQSIGAAAHSRPAVGSSSAEHVDGAPSTADAPVDVIAAERKQAARFAEEAGQLTVSAATTQERSAAMIKLNAMSSRLQNGAEPELVQALETAATGAPEWQLRITAVTALGNAAQRMPDNSRVLMILERAANDPHAAVAKRARTALQAVRGH